MRKDTFCVENPALLKNHCFIAGIFKFQGEQMGQAKLRGNKDQRIAQAIGEQAEKEKRHVQMRDALMEIPTPGLYISNKTGARFIVEDVNVSEAAEVEFDDDEDELKADVRFVVNLIEEDGAGDVEAMGYELDADEWLEFALLHRLFRA